MTLAAYTKTAWANGGTPAINATNLGKIETQLEDLTNAAMKIERYGASATGNDAYVVNNTYPAPALYAGMMISFKADVSNTGAATINIDGLGVKNLKKFDAAGKVALVTGDIIASGFYTAQYDGTDFIIINPTAILQSLITAQGDMLYGSAANTAAKLAKGTARQGLLMNSGATAPEWGASLQSIMTATGDMTYASGANTPAKLAVGATGQVLGVASGVPVWENPEWVLMETQTTASSATSVTFSTLGSYDVFKIVIMGCFSAAEDMLLRFNADSTNKYTWTQRGVSAGGATSESNSGGLVSAINLDGFQGDSVLHNLNYMELFITHAKPFAPNNYLRVSSYSKNMYFGGSVLESIGAYEPVSATALSSISLLRSSTATFINGTKLMLYGAKINV